MFRDHPGVAITLGALALASIGILHQFAILLQFDIQYFEYATASSFVVAAGKILDVAYLAEKRAYILGGAYLALGLLYFYHVFRLFVNYPQFFARAALRLHGIYLESNLPFNTKRLRILLNYRYFLIIYIILTWVGVAVLSVDTAVTRANKIKQGITDSVVVERKSNLPGIPALNPPKSKVQFITSTGEYVFLYEINRKSSVPLEIDGSPRVHVVRTDSIASIVKKLPRKIK